MVLSQENADRTSAFIVLIYLLRPVGSSKFAGLAKQGAAIVRNQKFLDLVVKCLIKLTKVMLEGPVFSSRFSELNSIVVYFLSLRYPHLGNGLFSEDNLYKYC